MSASSMETLDGFALDVTPIRALLEKRVLELSDDEVQKVTVFRQQLSEWGPQLASRMALFRLALQSLDAHLAKIEEAADLTKSSAGLGQTLDGLGTATQLLRTLSEKEVEAIRLLVRVNAGSTAHTESDGDSTPGVESTEDSVDALHDAEADSNGLSLFRPGVLGRFTGA